MNQEKVAQIELDAALKREKKFWQKKSRVTLDVEENIKTGYFHITDKVKSTTKLITFLKSVEVLNDLNQKNSITRHFIWYDLYNNFQNKIYVIV